MGFLKKFQLGKVLGGVARGFTSGGFYGAILQGGQAAAIASVKAGTTKAAHYGSGPARVTPTGSRAMYSGAAASFLPGYQLGQSVGSSDVPVVPVGNRSIATVTGDIYNALMTMLQRLGVTIRNPNSVIPLGKRALARIIAAARRIPGMTPIGMLVSLGLTEIAANQVVSWYTTSGKRRRRMRVTNVKALNRSARRLEGFLRLSRRVEGALALRSSRRVGGRRCRKCRKSPCGC